MGRKYKEKQIAASAGRRRPMIQLEGIGKRQVNESQSTYAAAKTTQSTGIGLLGAYQEESESSGESDQEQPSTDISKQSENGRAATGHKKTHIDDQLAGFLAEINALDTEKSPKEAGEVPETAAQDSSAQEVYDPNNFDPSTQWHLLPEPWQTCYDANSGYYYYWRTDNDTVQWTPPSPAASKPVSPSKSANTSDVEDAEGEMIGPQLPDDVETKSEDVANLEPKNEEAVKGSSDRAEAGGSTKVSSEVHATVSSLVSYGLEDVDHSDISDGDVEEKTKTEEIRPVKEDDGEGTNGDEKVENEEKGKTGDGDSSEETDEDITRKYSLHVSDDDIKDTPASQSKSRVLKAGGNHSDSDDSEHDRRSSGRRILRKYRKTPAKVEHKPEVQGQAGKTEKKQKRRRKSSKNSGGDKMEVKEGKGKFEVDMFAAESLSEGEIKSDDDDKVFRKAASPVSDQDSDSSSDSSSSSSESHSDSSDSDSGEEEQVEKKGKEQSKVEYEDISSDDSADTIPDDVNKQEKREEPRDVEVTISTEQEKSLAVEDHDNGNDSHESEEEMQEFAEMLLEGALGTDASPSDATKEKSVKPSESAPPSNNESEPKEEATDKDEEVISTLEPRPLLKAEVFEHIKKGEKKQKTYEDERKKVVESHRIPENSEEDYKAMISDTSSTLLEKLGFLDISRKGLTHFQIMLIEVETRLRDWREGALDGRYLVAKLALANEELVKYEATAAPEGWTCHWDSNYKMYYYYNIETEESTWQYPEVMVPLPSDETLQGTEKPPLPPEPEPESDILSAVIGPQQRPAQPPLPLGAPPEPQKHAPAPLPPQEISEASKDDEAKVTASTSPVGAFTQDSVISKPAKLAAVDKGEPKKVIMDPYRARLMKKKQVQSSSAPKVVDTDEQISQLFLGPSQPPPPPGEEMPPAPWDDPVPIGARSPSMDKTDDMPSLDVGVSGRDSPALTARKSSDLTASPVTTDTMAATPAVTSTVTQVSELLDNQATRTEVAQIPTKKVKGKKEKKRKVATATGIPSKKRKHVSSLVQKWQQVKQQVEEEMAEESSEEEDVEIVNQRKIEQWKAEQQSTGKAAYNPNFQEIKGDWRERVKKAREKRGLGGPS